MYHTDMFPEYKVKSYEKSFSDIQRDKEIAIRLKQYAKHKATCEKNRKNRKKRK